MLFSPRTKTCSIFDNRSFLLGVVASCVTVACLFGCVFCVAVWLLIMFGIALFSKCSVAISCGTVCQYSCELRDVSHELFGETILLLWNFEFDNKGGFCCGRPMIGVVAFACRFVLL